MTREVWAYPLHVMTKPEGIESYLDDFIRQKCDELGHMIRARSSRVLVTTLTDQQVELLYPDPTIPHEYKYYLTQHPTEHRIFHSPIKTLYSSAAQMKGKWGEEGGLRQCLYDVTTGDLGIFLEIWQNFIHTSSNFKEAHVACSHIMVGAVDEDICSSCIARRLCSQ